MERRKKADSGSRERRNRSRSGRSLPERRLDYWRQLERLGLTVVTEHPDWVPQELLSHHEALETQITQYETYLDALRKTIEAEETGFRDYENKFLERLERERKKRKQLREQIHRDRPDPADLSRQIGLSEEELQVLERRITEEEAKSTGQVHEALRELRLERIRRQRRAEGLRKQLQQAEEQDRAEADPRLQEIYQQITKLEAALHEQEEAIDGRLSEHQENLRIYSAQLTEFRDDQRDHLIKIGDAIFHHQLGGESIQGIFERLRRMIREGAK